MTSFTGLLQMLVPTHVLALFTTMMLAVVMR